MLSPYWIIRINKSLLGISACPPGGENLKAELAKAASEDNILLISLLTKEENHALQLQDEGSLSKDLGIAFEEFPITDTSIPGAESYIEFIEKLYARTKEFDSILIHCRAGIGRSSLIALGLMARHGLSLKESIKMVSKIRRYDVPQSRSQRKLLSFYSLKLHEKNEKKE